VKFSVARRPALPRLLGRPEVWAFGFTNFLLWVLVAPMVQEVAEAASPVLWRSGRTVMPGLRMSTRRHEMPWARRVAGSVRARSMHQSA